MFGVATQQRAAVQRRAERIDHPADPAVVRGDAVLACKDHPVADLQPLGGAVGQDGDMIGRQRQNLAADRAAVPVRQVDQIAQCRDIRQAGDRDQTAAKRADPPDRAHRADRRDLCGQGLQSHSVHAVFSDPMTTVSKRIRVKPWLKVRGRSPDV